MSSFLGRKLVQNNERKIKKGEEEDCVHLCSGEGGSDQLLFDDVISEKHFI